MTADLLSARAARSDAPLRTRDVAERPEAPAAFAAPPARYAALEDRLLVREEDPYWPGEAAAPPADDPELAALLVALRELAGGSDDPPGGVERWARIEIAPGVALSVRGVADENTAVLEAIGRRLRERLEDRFGD